VAFQNDKEERAQFIHSLANLRSSSFALRFGLRLLHQHELLLRGKFTGFDHIQIHAARHAFAALVHGVPREAVTAGIHLACDKLAHELAVRVVNRQRDFTRLRQGKADRRRRVKWVGIILLQREVGYW